MEYIFPPSNVGLVVAPPAALREAHYDSAGATAADVMETLSVISQHDEDESLFTSNNEAAGFLGTDWRPLIQLTLGLSDLYSWIRNQAAGKRHRQTRSGGQESEAAASGARDASVRWDDERPPTPSFADSGASTPMAASRSRGQSRPASVRPPMPPSAQHRDPNNSLPPLPRAASRSTLNSPPLLGAQQPIFVTAHPRVLTEPSDLVAKLHSDGNMYEVDNVNGDLVLFVGMVLCERYEVIKLLGAGTFGQVAMCRDHFACQHNAETSSALHRAESFLSSGSLSQRGSLRYPKVPHHHHHASLSSAAGSGQRHPNQSPASRRLMPELVAVKVIKSEAAYERQSALEVNVVREMARRFPHDPRLDLVVHSYGHGYSYGHYCLVFELLGVNLFDVLTANQYKGMDLSAVREVAQQLLMAVSLCHDCGITHSDIKPENVLLARPPVDDSTPADHSGSIRLIDFGAAFRTGHCPFTYIQSRYYRAPEVILDADLSAAIDIWSVGCVLAELFLGLPLLPGGDDFQQLELMQEMMGPFPSSIVMKGRLAPQYFTAVLTSSAPRPSLSTPLAPDSSPQLLNRTMTNPFDEWSTSSDSPLGSPMMAHVLPADDFYGRYPSLNRPEPQPKYFNYSSIPALVDNYPLSQREKDWAVDAQSRLNAQQPPGVKPSATFTQPVIDGILRFRRSFSSLLELLLRLDPSARPTASDALRHPFFQMDLPDLESFFGTG